MQFQYTCGMRRGGHVKRVYISLYMYVYTIYLNYLYIEYEELCTPTALECLPPRVSHNISALVGTTEGVGASLHCSFCRLCLPPPRLKNLFCSSVTGGLRVASVDGYSELEESYFLCWAHVHLSAAVISDRMISAACECNGLHRRLKFICTNYTWGPLDGIKISFLLTCIKFYF